MNKILNINRHWLLQVLIFCIFFANLLAQQNPIAIEHISADQGLSNNQIHCVIQDSYGFLWIGTNDGLNRYDGYEFVVYKNNVWDTTSLSSPSITSVVEGRNGDLWIGTTNGLNQYQRNSDSFVRYIHDPENEFSISDDDKIQAIIMDRTDSNYIWIGTYGDGLILFNTDLKRFYNIQHDSTNANSLSGDKLTSLFQDSFGDFWIGTFGDGLNKIKLSSIPRTSDDKYDITRFNSIVFEKYLIYQEIRKSISNVYDIFEDGSRRLWVLSDDLRVLIYDRENDQLIPNPYFTTNQDHFHEMLEDNKGVIWFGGDGIVVQLNQSNGKVNEYELNKEGIRSSSNQGLCEDKSGNIWVATWDGIVKIYENRTPFEHHFHIVNDSSLSASVNTYSLLIDRSGKLWIGTSSGVIQMLKNSDGSLKFINYFDAHEVERGNIYALAEDHGGSIWAVSDHTLVRIDPGTDTVIRYKNHPDNSNSLSFQQKENFVGTINILIDAENNLWVSALHGGISKVSLEELYFTDDLKDIEFTNYFSNPKDPVSLVNFFFQDKEGHLWICTRSSGIIDFDLKAESYRIYKQDSKNPKSLSINYATSAYKDKNRVLWIGTYGGGLNRFDSETKSFTHFNTTDGLPSDIINGILEDNSGNLWIATNGGITKFDEANHKIRNYDVQERDVYFKDKITGEMYFADTNGFIVFNPDSIKESKSVPPVIFTKFIRFTDEIEREKIIDRTISAKDKIELSYSENLISFEFAALDFNSNAKYYYSYQLEGLNKNWINIGNKREVTLTNLNPGDYTFRVKACNEDGNWCYNSASIKISISPPWWSTYWSYGIYGLLFISALYEIRRFELKRKKEKEDSRILELENKRKKEELEQARQLQLSMLPKDIPAFPNLDIAVYMKTATEVGGDYYDFYLSEDKILTVILGDATGHGLNAGMLVSVSKGLFLNLANRSDLKNIISQFNSSLISMQLQPMYMSLSLARIQHNQLQIVGAGMPPALYYNSRMSSIEEIESSGPPLGGFPNFSYAVNKYQLSGGDIIILLSDGFAERKNKNKETYGWNKGKELLAEMNHLSSNEIISEFVKISDQWGEGRPQDDDITILVFKVK